MHLCDMRAIVEQLETDQALCTAPELAKRFVELATQVDEAMELLHDASGSADIDDDLYTAVVNALDGVR
jgi:hypothetical protein